MGRVRLGDVDIDCGEGETLLDAVLRAGVDVPYSCKNGVCLTCMMRVTEGSVPETAQVGLKDTLRTRGYFLPCICKLDSKGADDNLKVDYPVDSAVFGRAVVVGVDELASDIRGVRLEPATPLFYHAGQFLNLRRADGLQRSYSLASVPKLDECLTLHVKRLPRGQMSNWVFDDLQPGAEVDIQGPNGNCFYLPGQAAQPMLLIGNGSGLAPLIGIARDALSDGHDGPIHLYHGSRHAKGLYLIDELRSLAEAHENFHYAPCVSGAGEVAAAADDGGLDIRSGRADAIAFDEHSALEGWRIFLCGYPPMVGAAKKRAYLSGADMVDIYADPFELRDLRHAPRS